MGFSGFTLGKAPTRQGRRPGLFEQEEDEEELPQQGAAPPSSSQDAAQEQEAGNRAAEAGDWGRALRHWDAALAASPADAHKLHESKAQVWLEVGEDWKALQCAMRAVELEPDWAAGHLTLARVQLNMGEPELALASMGRCLQLDPGHPEAGREIGSIHSVVLQRQQSGSVAAGQRAQVVVQAAVDMQVEGAAGLPGGSSGPAG